MNNNEIEILKNAVKQVVLEIFDEETISQIDLCIRRIIIEELTKLLK